MKTPENLKYCLGNAASLTVAARDLIKAIESLDESAPGVSRMQFDLICAAAARLKVAGDNLTPLINELRRERDAVAADDGEKPPASEYHLPPAIGRDIAEEMLTCIEALRGNIDVSTINNSKRASARWGQLVSMSEGVIQKYGPKIRPMIRAR